jgi:predicted regulator of Ras-like GTPase activity (Roadblock/LC7/MglB family)
MSFETILRNILDSCGGGLGVVLMGSDGIPIVQLEAEGVRRRLGDELGLAGVEFGRILSELRKVTDALGGGELAETTVVLSRFTLVCRPMDADTFLMLAIAPDGNLGKARYLMRRHQPAIREQL